MEDDTIVAVSTPPGRGAIGIVRLSGARCAEFAALLAPEQSEFKVRHATLTRLTGHDKNTLDDAVVTLFRGPHSYTGEDVLEISCHGSSLVLDRVVAACLTYGARAARPGEFTLRAFLNGQLDLTQAEAVVDLIEARSDAGVGLALQQLEGALGSRIAPIRSNLLDLLAHIVAVVEFSEEDLPPVTATETAVTLMAVREQLSALLANSRQGQALQHGVSMAIVGAPNAGKSSILNQLLGRDRAIVSSTPGTTRDTLEEELVLDGILFHAVDTAGIVDTEDEIEALGVKRSRSAMAAADLALVVIDASKPLVPAEVRILDALGRPGSNETPTAGPSIAVAMNKSDAGRVIESHELRAWIDQSRIVGTCALNSEGLESLRQLLVELALDGPIPDGFVVSNQRHVQSLREATVAVARALAAHEAGTPLDLIALDIRAAAESLDQILGIGLSDEVLDRVFSRFCIGK